MHLDEGYRNRGVRALVIDVLEPEATVRAWAERVEFTLPMLLDTDGKVAEAYAPVGVLPELPRSQVPIASNLVIDREGRVQFYELLDSRNFDAKLIRLKARLDELLERESPPEADGPASAATILHVTTPAGVRLEPGGSAVAELEVRIDDGYHVMANPASEVYLEPLELELSGADGIEPGQVTYPPAIAYAVDGFEKPLATYEGTVTLAIRIEAAAEASPGRRQLGGELHFQGCSRHACLIPSSVPVHLDVNVAN